MKKVFNELRKNKYTTLAIVAFFLIVVLGILLYNYLFSSSGSPVYGNRLDGIEEVAIDEKDLKSANEKMKENSIVASSKSNISGRTINFILTVKEGTPGDDAKKLPMMVLENFSKEQKAYFDIQVFIVCEDDKAQGYPIIGYMDKNKDVFSFSSAS